MAKNFGKNLAKSFGIDLPLMIIKESAPFLYEAIKQDIEDIPAIKEELSYSKNKGKEYSGKLLAGVKTALSKQTLKNAKNDLLAGRIFGSPERGQRAIEKATMGDFDMDMDSSFDEMNSAFEGFESGGKSSNESSSYSDSFSDSGNDISSEFNVNKTQNMYDNKKITTNITNSVDGSLMRNVANTFAQGSANTVSSIEKINEFNSEATTEFYNKTYDFYESTTKSLTEIVETLNSVYKHQVANTAQNIMSDMFGNNGFLDIKSYMKAVNPIRRLGEFFEDEEWGMYKGFFDNIQADPIGTIFGSIINAMTPDRIKDEFGKVEENINKLTKHMVIQLAEGRAGEGGFIKQVLGQLFGLDLSEVGSKKAKVNLANYEKGPIPFDGVTKKAIVETIPFYLAKILANTSALVRHFNAKVNEGTDMIHMDYESGKFYTQSRLQEINKIKENDRIESAYRDVFKDLEKNIDKEAFNSLTPEEKKKYIEFRRSESSINVKRKKLKKDIEKANPIEAYKLKKELERLNKKYEEQHKLTTDYISSAKNDARSKYGEILKIQAEGLESGQLSNENFWNLPNAQYSYEQNADRLYKLGIYNFDQYYTLMQRLHRDPMLRKGIESGNLNYLMSNQEINSQKATIGGTPLSLFDESSEYNLKTITANNKNKNKKALEQMNLFSNLSKDYNLKDIINIPDADGKPHYYISKIGSNETVDFNELLVKKGSELAAIKTKQEAKSNFDNDEAFQNKLKNEKDKRKRNLKSYDKILGDNPKFWDYVSAPFRWVASRIDYYFQNMMDYVHKGLHAINRSLSHLFFGPMNKGIKGFWNNAKEWFYSKSNPLYDLIPKDWRTDYEKERQDLLKDSIDIETSQLDVLNQHSELLKNLSNQTEISSSELTELVNAGVRNPHSIFTWDKHLTAVVGKIYTAITGNKLDYGKIENDPEDKSFFQQTKEQASATYEQEKAKALAAEEAAKELNNNDNGVLDSAKSATLPANYKELSTWQRFKQRLIGKDNVYTKNVYNAETGQWEDVQTNLTGEDSLFTILHHRLASSTKGTRDSIKSSISKKKDTVSKALKNFLIGDNDLNLSDDEKEKLSLFTILGKRIDKSIINPAKDFLFGEPDSSGKRPASKWFDKNKDQLMSMGIGGIVGGVGGSLLFSMNPLLAAGLGMFAGSNKFQEEFFGDKETSVKNMLKRMIVGTGKSKLEGYDEKGLMKDISFFEILVKRVNKSIVKPTLNTISRFLFGTKDKNGKYTKLGLIGTMGQMFGRWLSRNKIIDKIEHFTASLFEFLKMEIHKAFLKMVDTITTVMNRMITGVGIGINYAIKKFLGFRLGTRLGGKFSKAAKGISGFIGDSLSMGVNKLDSLADKMDLSIMQNKYTDENGNYDYKAAAADGNSRLNIALMKKYGYDLNNKTYDYEKLRNASKSELQALSNMYNDQDILKQFKFNKEHERLRRRYYTEKFDVTIPKDKKVKSSDLQKAAERAKHPERFNLDGTYTKEWLETLKKKEAEGVDPNSKWVGTTVSESIGSMTNTLVDALSKMTVTLARAIKGKDALSDDFSLADKPKEITGTADLNTTEDQLKKHEEDKEKEEEKNVQKTNQNLFKQIAGHTAKIPIFGGIISKLLLVLPVITGLIGKAFGFGKDVFTLIRGLRAGTDLASISKDLGNGVLGKITGRLSSTIPKMKTTLSRGSASIMDIIGNSRNNTRLLKFKYAKDLKDAMINSKVGQYLTSRDLSILYGQNSILRAPFQMIKAAPSAIAQTYGNVAGGMIGAAAKPVTGLLKGYANTAKAAGGIIKTVGPKAIFSRALPAIGSLYSIYQDSKNADGSFDIAKGLVGETGNTVKELFMNAGKTALKGAGIGVAFGGPIGALIGGAVGGLFGLFGTDPEKAAKLLSPMLESAGESFSNFISKIGDGIADFVPSLIEKVVSVIVEPLDMLAEWLDSDSGEIKGNYAIVKFGKAVLDVGKKVGSLLFKVLWSIVKSAGKLLWKLPFLVTRALLRPFAKVGKKIGGWIAKKLGFLNVFETAISKIEGFFGTVFEFIDNPIDFLKKRLITGEGKDKQGGFRQLKGDSSLESERFKAIKGYANGGLITKPSVVVAGENEPEVIAGAATIQANTYKGVRAAMDSGITTPTGEAPKLGQEKDGLIYNGRNWISKSKLAYGQRLGNLVWDGRTLVSATAFSRERGLEEWNQKLWTGSTYDNLKDPSTLFKNSNKTKEDLKKDKKTHGLSSLFNTMRDSMLFGIIGELFAGAKEKVSSAWDTVANVGKSAWNTVANVGKSIMGGVNRTMGGFISSDQLKGASVPDRIYSFLRTKGMSHNQTVAIMGNIQQESNFNTKAISFDGEGSIGLMQWTGPRRKALQQFASKMGKKEDDLDAQLNFMWHELVEDSSGYEAQQFKKFTALGKDMDVGTLTKAFSDHVERPNAKYANNRQRIAYASQFEDKYRGSVGDNLKADNSILGRLFGGGNGSGSKVVELARQYIPKLGGPGHYSQDFNARRNIDNGTADCSGFTAEIFRKVYGDVDKGLLEGNGDNLSAMNGYRFTNDSEAMPGDMIFFRDVPNQNMTCAHVGIVSQPESKQMIDIGSNRTGLSERSWDASWIHQTYHGHYFLRPEFAGGTATAAQGAFIGRNTPKSYIVGDNLSEGEIIAPESKIYNITKTALKDLLLNATTYFDETTASKTKGFSETDNSYIENANTTMNNIKNNSIAASILGNGDDPIAARLDTMIQILTNIEGNTASNNMNASSKNQNGNVNITFEEVINKLNEKLEKLTTSLDGKTNTSNTSGKNVFTPNRVDPNDPKGKDIFSLNSTVFKPSTLKIAMGV